MKVKTLSTTHWAIIAGIVVLVNILSYFLFIRFDFTKDQRYTLSWATKNILTTLKEPVSVSAYFTTDLPPQYSRVRTEFKELLVEYQSLSRGMVTFELLDPKNNQEVETAAMQAGVQPVIVNVRERDQVKQQKAFLGAVVKIGDRKEVIPFIQPESAMEYALSTAIRKLASTNKPLVGIFTGFGQPPLSSLQQVMAGLQVLYNVEEVDLSEPAFALNKYKALVMIGPTETIPQELLARLNQYLASGGNLLIALNRVAGDFNTLQGYSVETGVEGWLAEKGVLVESSFIVDASCGSVGVTQQSGTFQYTTNISFPYMPLIKNYADHPITKGLGMVLLQLASPISYTGDTSIHFQPIAFSSEKSGALPVPLQFELQKQWTEKDFTRSSLPVMAVIEGPLAGRVNSRLIVIGDADFVVQQGRQQLQPDNVSLLVNAVDWLSDDTGLIELRTRGIKALPLDTVSDGRKMFLKLLNFLLPILLIVGYGIYRIIRNRNIRMRRMEDVYI